MACIDGIKNKIEPAAPVDKDLYELPPDEAADIPQAPATLAQVMDNLEADHEYLTEGGVFTPDLIENWIRYKRDHEITPITLRPHPYEFALYYDC
jgi:glutamine synthetase